MRHPGPRFDSRLGLAVLGLVLAGGLGGILRDSSSARADTPRPAEDAFLALNKAFRAAYGRRRAEVLAGLRPVILHWGDTVVLLHDGRRTEKEYLPPLYDNLKTFSHVPLALYVMLRSPEQAVLSEQQLADLRRYRELVVAARGDLAKRGFSAEQQERQQKLVAAALTFLDRVLERRQVKREELTEFTRGTAPLVLANATDAARVQLDALHAQVMAWRKEIPPERWKDLRVVVMGGHTPRVGNVATQYFARLLGEPLDDRRLVYAEGLGDEKRALDVLGTCVLDAGVGASFFGEDLRMHRDLLADAAAEYVKQLSFDP